MTPLAFSGKMLEIPVQGVGNTFAAGLGSDDDAIDINKSGIAFFEPEKIKTGVVGLRVKGD